MNDLQKMLDDLITGKPFDERQEIIILWYEITYLRLVTTRILQKNPELAKEINEETFDQCRKQAEDIVKTRFPNLNLKFEIKATTHH